MHFTFALYAHVWAFLMHFLTVHRCTMIMSLCVRGWVYAENSHPRPCHLSLLCIRPMWECASGKSPCYLMLLISQHLTLVFSPLCFGTRVRKTLCVCVCVYIRPRTSSPLMLQWEACAARRTPDWQAYRTPPHTYAHMPVRAHTHMLFCTHVSCTFTSGNRHKRLSRDFTASSFTAAVKPKPTFQCKQ